jgi:hypothetical protein
MKRVVVSIYIDPDFYPPTINAIIALSEAFDEVVVVTRNNSENNFPFPHNVKLRKCGTYMTVRQTESTSALRKIISFVSFTFTLFKAVISKKTRLLVLFDPLPLFSFYLFAPLISKKKKIWYHNHDMPRIDKLRKYAIGWFAAKAEHRAMKAIDFFSLPSSDRLEFYPNLENKIPFFNLPNYPSLKVYRKIENKEINKVLKIIYQGFIGPGHALEEILPLLKETIENHQLKLVLKGSVRDDYKLKIHALADSYKVTDHIIWLGIGPYAELPGITSGCDIGIAIHMNTDNVSRTLGTASNKIYEYAACGLPAILYKNEQFEKYLSNYEWTYFSDGTTESLRQSIKSIIRDLSEVGSKARMDFEKELNFEMAYQPALGEVLKSLHQ